MSIEKARVLHLFFCLHTVDIFIWCYWLILVWCRRRCSSSQLFVTQIYKGCIFKLTLNFKASSHKVHGHIYQRFHDFTCLPSFLQKASIPLLPYSELVLRKFSRCVIASAFKTMLSTIKFRRIRELKFL